jgi:DNA-3-methyladenine glycosylase II
VPTLETTLAPRPPYSLELSARMRSDATRVWREGTLTMVFEAGAPALARVRQRPDGVLAVRLESAEPEPALSVLRFVLATDDDHSEFLRRFADDPLVGPAIGRTPGLRPLRSATVTHALLKAVCGQLIQARAARVLEARLLRRFSPEHEGLRMPPRRETFGALSPAELGRWGLVSRKATALVRVSRELDLERLRSVATAAAVARIVRERGLGPWSAGVVCLAGLGRYEHGLVGDLGLVKLCAALRGRPATAEDTAELLAPYGEWAGLASVYLLAGAGPAGRGKPRPYKGRRSGAGYVRTKAAPAGYAPTEAAPAGYTQSGAPWPGYARSGVGEARSETPGAGFPRSGFSRSSAQRSGFSATY